MPDTNPTPAPAASLTPPPAAAPVPPHLPVTSPVAKGPTETPPPKMPGEKQKILRGKIKPEAMGSWEPSGYQAPGGPPFLLTEARAAELGERVEILGEAEEGADHFAPDVNNPHKNQPVIPEGTPGAETPLDPSHK